jgi:hypothetical protein
MKCQSMAVSCSRRAWHCRRTQRRGQTRSFLVCRVVRSSSVRGRRAVPRSMYPECRASANTDAMTKVSGADCRLQRVEAVIQRRKNELAECNDGRLFFPACPSFLDLKDVLPRSASNRLRSRVITTRIDKGASRTRSCPGSPGSRPRDPWPTHRTRWRQLSLTDESHYEE